MVETLPFEDYLKREALSASGAKKLLKAAALYRHGQDHPAESKPHFDLGKVVHTLVLGVGEPVEVLTFDDWRSKAARDAKAEAVAAGRIPLLEQDYLQAEAMAAAVRGHRLAATLLGSGDAEQSWFWEAEGVPMKARTDWLTRVAGQPVIADLKTSASADPREFRRSAATFGYAVQDAIHREGVQAHLGEDVGFLFVVVEKAAPYLVSVVELDDEAKGLGEQLAAKAKALYKHCRATGEWPGYPQNVTRISLPSWVYMEEESA